MCFKRSIHRNISQLDWKPWENAFSFRILRWSTCQIWIRCCRLRKLLKLKQSKLRCKEKEQKEKKKTH